MEAVKTIDLTKKYKNITAVERLNLTVMQGEVFSLLGMNGAGKTTTVKMLSCLALPDGGDAFLLGQSILSERAKVKAFIGLSPQETAVAPNLTAGENLALMCGIHGFGRETCAKKTAEFSERFGLGPCMKRKAGVLSGGWQRRLSLAMALIGEPKILFLDEPTLGLDVLARRDLWDAVRALKREVTVILTTHSMEEAQALSDRIGVMKDGRLQRTGTVKELMAATGASAFAKRNRKEILRDPLNLLFGLGFPVALLLLLAARKAFPCVFLKFPASPPALRYSVCPS